MWVVLLALLGAAQAANFETATVDGELAITSSWDGGFCGSLMTRNPGNNPSSSWAGLFTFTGGVLTTGPNGNGVAEQLSPSQWTFVPNDPAQMAIYSQSTVMVTFCCEANRAEDVQASFRVIFSYDYRGVGYNPPPPSPPSPPPPSPSPPPPTPPSPRPPPPSPRSPPPPSPKAPAPAPAVIIAAGADLVGGAPDVEAPSPSATEFAVTEASMVATGQQGSTVVAQDVAQTAPPAVPTTSGAGAAQAAGVLVALLAAAAALLMM